MPEDIFRIEDDIEVVQTGRRKRYEHERDLRALVRNWTIQGDAAQYVSIFGETVNETYKAATELKRLYEELTQRPDVARLLRHVAITKFVMSLVRVRDRKVIATVDVLAGTYTYEGRGR